MEEDKGLVRAGAAIVFVYLLARLFGARPPRPQKGADRGLISVSCSASCCSRLMLMLWFSLAYYSNKVGTLCF